jgi:hypothetical protein
MIEVWCKKKLVFAHPLPAFGTVREAQAHCTLLQIAQADTQTKICKRVQFSESYNINCEKHLFFKYYRIL